MVVPQVYKNLGLHNQKMVNLEKQLLAKINQNEYKATQSIVGLNSTVDQISEELADLDDKFKDYIEEQKIAAANQMANPGVRSQEDDDGGGGNGIDPS